MSIFLSIGGVGNIIILKNLNCFEHLRQIQEGDLRAKKRQKKANYKIKKQRGRKSPDADFSKGKQSIVRVDPYRKNLRFGKKRVDAVVDGFSHAFSLFAGKTIQNNLSETINSVFKSHVCLSGPKTLESARRVFRTMAIVRNNSALLENIKVEHSLRVNFLFNNVNVDFVSCMIEKGWEIYSVKKMD